MNTLDLTRIPAIPDSPLAQEATKLLRKRSTDLLFNHSMRVYLFGATIGELRNLLFDSELLYLAAIFRDSGLIKELSSPQERFEVEGANAARDFLKAHNIGQIKVRIVWEAIALHMTPGIPLHKRPEAALLYAGVLLDVMGKGFDGIPADLTKEIVAQYPRKNFKNSFVQEYFASFAHNPEAAYVVGY